MGDSAINGSIYWQYKEQTDTIKDGNSESESP